MLNFFLVIFYIRLIFLMAAKPYLIELAYDGTGYHGWQEQKNQRTVAGVLQDTFLKLFGQEIKTVGASRTDAGVHALGQGARFYADLALEPEKILKVWNDSLPKDINIFSLKFCPEAFHPQHNVLKKVYWYHFLTKRPMPFFSRYVSYWFYEIEMKKLESTLQKFLGMHDFKFFATETRGKETVCVIDEIFVEYVECYKAYRITVSGKRFLHNMVRRIVGAALKVSSSEDYSIKDIDKILGGEKILKQFPIASACGLVLNKIIYKNDFRK